MATPCIVHPTEQRPPPERRDETVGDGIVDEVERLAAVSPGTMRTRSMPASRSRGHSSSSHWAANVAMPSEARGAAGRAARARA
jgi:hypothetical protein